MPAAGAAAAVLGQGLLSGSAAQATLSQPSTPVHSAPSVDAATVAQISQLNVLAPAATTDVPVVAAPAGGSAAAFAAPAAYQPSNVQASAPKDVTQSVQDVARPVFVPSSFPTLKKSADLSKLKEHVLYVQKKLGVIKGDATLKTEGAGVYGPRTQAAVQRFQRANDMTADGAIGEKTWKKISALSGTWSDTGSSSNDRASRSSSRTSAPTFTVPASGSKVRKALAIATDIADDAKANGIRYVYGAKRTGYGDKVPTTFDCSSFVSYAFKQVGINLTAQSGAMLKEVQRISKSEARPGDLYFKRNGSGSITHVGFVGDVVDGKQTWVEARSSKSGVDVFDSMWTGSSTILYGRVA